MGEIQKDIAEVRNLVDYIKEKAKSNHADEIEKQMTVQKEIEKETEEKMEEQDQSRQPGAFGNIIKDVQKLSARAPQTPK